MGNFHFIFQNRSIDYLNSGQRDIWLIISMPLLRKIQQTVERGETKTKVLKWTTWRNDSKNPQQYYNKNWCNFIWFLCVFDACERCQVKQPSLNKTHALTKNERKPIKNCKIWTIESECLTKSSCQMQTNSIRMQFWCCDSSMCKRDHRYKMRFCLSICSAMCWFQLLSYMSKRH